MSVVHPYIRSEDQPTFGNANEERLVSSALQAAVVPGELLAQLPPPLPQIDPWRPRMGYDQRALRIEDVIDLNRLYPDNRTWYSGGPWGWQAAARNTMSTTGLI